MKDREILEMIRNKDIIFLTLDKDFINLYLNYRGEVKIVIFNIHPPLPNYIVSLLEKVLKRLEELDLDNGLVIVGRNTVRIIK